MAYGITPNGFEIKPLAVIREDINDFQLAEIDPGLDQDDRAALQQINAVHAGALAELWELAQAVYNAAYPDSANDDSLDNVASITGTTRSPTTKTVVEDVSVTLSPNAALPAGSVAHLSNQPNARFVSLATVPADPIGGVFTVDFEAEDAGAIFVAPNQLDTIAEPVTGWTAVDNGNAGEPGEDTETDAELRIKRIEELEAQGSTNVNSIRADLRGLDGVVDSVVFENDTDFLDAQGIPPHSIYCVVRGGASADIAQQIFESKAAGINTKGTQIETVTDSMGFDHTIRFDYATQLDFYADITVDTDTLTFDAVDGPAAIKAAIRDYVNALRIGGDVIYDLVKCAAFEIEGVLTITTLKIAFVDPPLGVIDLPVDDDEFALSDVANIDVTVTP
jgi:uncharacterized phage protein gp47/JayE